MRLRNIIFLMILILTVNFAIATPVSVNGKLRVSGLQLVNECGNPVQLRGVSTHGLQWYGDCVNDTSLSFAATTMGADIVRITVYVDEGGYLTTPAATIAQVDSLVDKIGALGMYALIDWHVLTPGDPNAHLTEAGTFWQHEATQHKGKKYVLYEICNEPNGVLWSVVKQYADNIIPKIRLIDPDTVIICGTPNWSQLGNAVVTNQLSYPNIMYTFHFYAATHPTSYLIPYVGSLPIFCTEWAACASNGGGALDTVNSTKFLNIMNGSDTVNNPGGIKISWCSWSYSDAGESSAMFNANTCPSGYSVGSLTQEGVFIRNNILTPGKTFIACNTTPTFTPTLTRTRTPSFTATRTSTPTGTPTYTYTGTYIKTATPTLTIPVNTPTFTYTNTQSSTRTFTRTLTATFTGTPYYSPSVTPSITETVTGPPPTQSNTPTSTMSNTVTCTSTETPVSTPTFTLTSTLTATQSVTCTNSPVNTFTYTVTVINTPSYTKTPVNTVTVTNTAVMTFTNTITPQDTTTNTPQTAATFTRTATATSTPIVITSTPTATMAVTGPVEILYPNPYIPKNGGLNLVFFLDNQADEVEFTVFSRALRLIAKVKLGAYPSGFNKAEIDKKYFLNFATGQYYYVLNYKNANSNKKTKIRNFFILHN